MPTIEYDQRPMWLKHPAVQGVFVDGCVKRGDGSRFRALAHAHNDKKSPYAGWICFLSHKRLNEYELGLHELAHVITMAGHVDKWRRCLLELGGKLCDQYNDYRKFDSKGKALTSY